MSRVYVGNLPMDVSKRDIDDLFYKFEPKSIEIKSPARPPAFAFITFDDSRDADDAIKARNEYEYLGMRLRVEMAKGERGYVERRSGGGGGGRRTDYGVIVSHLPRGCSWQDLKDYFRKSGDVVFADVDRHGEGIVEFSNRKDMEYAVRKLDDTELRTPVDDRFIRVKFRNVQDEDDFYSSKGRGRDRDRDRRSRSDSRRRSPSRSSRDRSRSRSSESKDRSYKGKKLSDRSPSPSPPRSRSPSSTR